MRSENLIGLTELKTQLTLIENFHFIFTAVCSMRPSGLESKFSKTSRDIRKAAETKEKGKIIRILNDLKKSFFEERVPKESTFIEEFEKLKYTKNFTNNKSLIQYIFKKYERFLHTTDELEISHTTLEHILAQSIGNPNYVGKIGNLFLLDKVLNNDAEVLPLSDKFAYYQQSELKSVQKFCRDYRTEPVWTNNLINARTTEIAKFAYNNIWKV